MYLVSTFGLWCDLRIKSPMIISLNIWRDTFMTKLLQKGVKQIEQKKKKKRNTLMRSKWQRPTELELCLMALTKLAMTTV